MWMITGANGYRQNTNSHSPSERSGWRHFDALVMDQGKIVAVGDESELRLQFGARVSRILDVEGATVIPGLIDSHLHVAALGEQASQLDLSDTRSAHELLQRVRDFCARVPMDSWILGRGWDDNRFNVPGLPSLPELDAATGGRPMLLTRICHHAYLANTAAFERAGLTPNSPDPEDGYYGRDEHGNLNGRVFENASKPLLRAIPRKSREAWRDAVKVGMEKVLRSGITGVHTDDVRSLGSFDAVWQTYHSLIHDTGLRLRVHELVDWGSLDETLQVQSEYAVNDDWFSRGAAKLFSDGALGSRTAWFSEPYSDLPGWMGTPIYEPDELFERVRVAHEKGFGAAIHAIGDRAVDLALHAMDAAPAVGQRDRLIHAEVIRPDIVSFMQSFGDRLAVDVQPRFTVSDFPWLADRVGPDRVKYACAWRTLAQAGVHIAGGSDAPIEPVAPLLGIHAAHTRRVPFSDGPTYGADECLSAQHALALFTHLAAFAAGQEEEYGTIALGRAADLTILSQDIVNPKDPDDILSAKVLYTIVGGEVAYSALDNATEESAG